MAESNISRTELGTSPNHGASSDGPPQSQGQPVARMDDWQTVDFPNAISIDAIERQAMYDSSPVQPTVIPLPRRDRPSPEVILPTLSTDLTATQGAVDALLQSPTAPEVSDLIALIQDLNQCNAALLDRVHDLEIQLEATQQSALPELPNATAQPHTVIETLTAQLDMSQERITELEQECSLAHQRYQEQLQQMAEVEAICRDLRSRLHRQQRYTLQFKVALEKSVNGSSLGELADVAEEELVVVAPLESEPSALKTLPVRGIQPWSSQPASPPPDKLTDRLRLVAHSDRTPTPIPAVAEPISTPPLQVFGEGETTTPANCTEPLSPEFQNLPVLVPPSALPSKLVALTKPERGGTTESQTAESQSDGAESLAASAATSPTSDRILQFPIASNQTQVVASSGDRSINDPWTKPEQPSASPEVPMLDPALLQQLDAAVQPLIDSVMGVIKAETTPTADFASETAIAPSTAAPGAQSALPAPAEDVPRDPVAELSADLPAPDQQVISPEAEETLWKDLARLVDISTDDLVQASLAGDFDAFAAINYDAVSAPAEPALAVNRPAAPVAPIATTEPAAVRSSTSPSLSPSPTLSPTQQTTPPKRKTLAAVDLPSFPRM